MSIVKEEHKATLRKWHEELQEKRGERASLRRSTTVMAKAGRSVVV